MIALAWRNLWRQPKRTLITLLAIVFTCVVMVFLLALQVGTYASMKDNSLNLFDGYAQIQQPGFLDEPEIRKSFTDPGPLAQAVENVPGVETVAVRAQTYALLTNNSRSFASMIVGVSPEKERRVSRIAAMVKAGRYLRDMDSAELVLGEGLARNLGLKVGDTVTLLGMGRDGSVAADKLVLVGLFSSGMKDMDRLMAEMPLGRFQADFAMPGQANVLVISGATLDDVSRALPEIDELSEPLGLKVRGWGELEPGLHDAIMLDASTSGLSYAALVIVVIAILLNTLLMSILERTREFGILLALGMRPAVAGRMVWLEIMMLVGLGLLIGVGLGAALAGWFSVYGLELPGAEGVFAQWGLSGRVYPKLTALSVFAAPCAIAVCTLLAGFYPYIRLHRLQPVTAMRSS